MIKTNIPMKNQGVAPVRMRWDRRPVAASPDWNALDGLVALSPYPLDYHPPRTPFDVQLGWIYTIPYQGQCNHPTYMTGTWRVNWWSTNTGVAYHRWPSRLLFGFVRSATHPCIWLVITNNQHKAYNTFILYG
jgi:hypothetical protein